MNEPSPASLFDPSTSLVFVVDDMPENIQVVGGTLRRAGYQVAFAQTAAQAWSRLNESRPDLILLDVRMPGTDGFEFCRRLREDPDLRQVPVIFLSAAVEMQQVLEGFAIGAVDYVTKPFNAAELLARVRTHIELKLARDTLAQQYREQRLLLEEKNEIIRLVGHNLRNPLWAILGFARHLSEHPAITASDLTRIPTQLVETAQRMMNLVNDLLDTDALDHGMVQLAIEDFDLAAVVDDVLTLFGPAMSRKGQTLNGTRPPEPIPIRTDRRWVSQILENLVSNAVKFSPGGTPIYVALRRAGNRARVEVTDSGPGISPTDRSRLFQKFARLSARPTGGEPSTGLGLAIAKRLANLLGADLRCQSQPEHEIGSQFVLELDLTVQSGNPNDISRRMSV